MSIWLYNSAAESMTVPRQMFISEVCTISSLSRKKSFFAAAVSVEAVPTLHGGIGCAERRGRRRPLITVTMLKVSEKDEADAG